MKFNVEQTFAEELELADPTAHAKRQLLATLTQVCDKIFVPQREVCAVRETVSYSLDLNILSDQELQQLMETMYQRGVFSQMSSTKH